MNVVVLAPQTPFPPTQGAAMRNYHILRALAGKHDVSLIAFDPTPTPGAREHLQSFCRTVELVPPPPRRGLPRRAWQTAASPLPDLAVRLRSPAANERLGRLLSCQPVDLLHVEGIEMAELALGHRRGARRGLAFDDHNAEYMIQRRAFETDLQNPRRLAGALYSLLQWKKLARYEGAIIRSARMVTCVSEADRAFLVRLAPEASPVAIPNALDVASYRYRPVAERPATPELLFTGTMDYRPNVDAVTWFASAILPRIREAHPQARLTVVGRNPAPSIQKLGGPGIRVTGAVPDVRPYLEEGAAYICPLRMGSGTRFKVLEAMASGIPVVTTTVGAEGLGATHGQELLIADDAAAFAAAVVAVLDNRERSTELAERAAVLIRRRFDWSAVTPALLDLYEAIERGGRNLIQ